MIYKLSKPLEDLKDEFYCGKMSAKIAMMKIRTDRIKALNNVPPELKPRVEHLVREIYESARKYRQ